MKTTLATRAIANPRRTTLAHLQDAGELGRTVIPAPAQETLPASTANPRRTVLVDAPTR